jgi:uncharacterized protein (DUF1778 family)
VHTQRKVSVHEQREEGGTKMAAPMRADRKSNRLGLRLSGAQNAVLRAASEVEGTTVSDFVLRHATRAAEDTLADRRLFVLAEREWALFNALLERPETEVPKLRELMTAPSVFDEE